MTPDQKRKLQRMIWMQRLKVVAPSAAVVLVFAGIYVWAMAGRIAQADPVTGVHLVFGTVEGTPRLTGRRGPFRVHVRLNGGGEAYLASQLPQPPHDGEKVELRASDHASGRVTYALVRFLD